MKKGVKIAIIVGAIVLVIALAGGYFFMNDIAQKTKILEEFAQIEKLTDSENFDMTALSEKTSKIVTKGKYATVEKAAKTYASDLFNTAFKIKTLMEDEKLAKILTAENYQEDGPEFVETKKYISEAKQRLENDKKEMLSYLEESKINSYIEAETTDEYYINLYKELVTQDIEISDAEKDELEKSIDMVVSLLDTADEIIDFLNANKGKWEVQGEQVVFANNELMQTYNSFLAKLQ